MARALIVGQRSSEVWTFELPCLTLRRRHPLDLNDTPIGDWTIAPGGTLVGWQTTRSGELDDSDRPMVCDIVESIDGRRRSLPVTASGVPKDVAATNDWIVLLNESIAAGPLFPNHGRTSIHHLLDSTNLAVRARITIDGAEWTSARVQADRLIAFDSCGRVIVMSLTSGAVLREHHLT